MSHFVISDLHGQLNLWRQVEQKLTPGKDQIIVLGDCVDRGPYPFQTLQVVMDSPLKPTLLLGNHENIFASAMIYMQENGEDIPDGVMHLLSTNGSDKTIIEWAKLTNKDFSWIDKILELPFQAEYFNKKLNIHFIMTHSGYIPKDLDDDNECEKAIWDRNHIFQTDDPPIPDNTIIIHGHTIIPYVKERMFWSSDEEYQKRWEITGAFKYDNGKKIDIDACSFITNSTILFNLDTLEETVLTTAPISP